MRLCPCKAGSHEPVFYHPRVEESQRIVFGIKGYGVALIGSKRGRSAEIADQDILICFNYYRRGEDGQMGIWHILRSALMESPQFAEEQEVATGRWQKKG
jgi:hypothetical protein